MKRRVKQIKMNNSEIKVAIHDGKESETVIRFIDLSDTPDDFQNLYNNGHIWGCYDEDGEIKFTDDSGVVYAIEEDGICIDGEQEYYKD